MYFCNVNTILIHKIPAVGDQPDWSNLNHSGPEFLVHKYFSGKTLDRYELTEDF